MVVSGEVTPSQRVSESSLAGALSVSRTPVREALQRLEAEGLVLTAGRGVQVRVLTAAELDEVLEARAALEGAAASRVAEQVAVGEVAPARLEELGHLADVSDAASRVEDPAAAAAANRRFHEALAHLAGNRVVVELLTRFWDQIEIATRAGLNRRPRVEQVDLEHRQLLAALRAGDAAGAREAAVAHIRATREALQEGPR